MTLLKSKYKTIIKHEYSPAAHAEILDWLNTHSKAPIAIKLSMSPIDPRKPWGGPTEGVVPQTIIIGFADDADALIFKIKFT